MWRYFGPRKEESWRWLWLHTDEVFGTEWRDLLGIIHQDPVMDHHWRMRGEGVQTHCQLLNCTYGWMVVTLIKKQHTGRYFSCFFFFFPWKKEVSLRMGLDHKEQLTGSVYWWVKSGLLQVAQRQRICLPIQEMLETWVRSLEAEMATHSSILTGKTAWPEGPGGLQFMGTWLSSWAHRHSWWMLSWKWWVSPRRLGCETYENRAWGKSVTNGTLPVSTPTACLFYPKKYR